MDLTFWQTLSDGYQHPMLCLDEHGWVLWANTPAMPLVADGRVRSDVAGVDVIRETLSRQATWRGAVAIPRTGHGLAAVNAWAVRHDNHQLIWLDGTKVEDVADVRHITYQLVDTAMLGMAVIAPDGTLTRANGTFHHQFNLDETKMGSNAWLTALAPGDRAQAQAVILQELETQRTRKLELTVGEGPSARTLAAEIAPIHHTDGTLYGLVVRTIDITARLNTHAQLARLNRELQNQIDQAMLNERAMRRMIDAIGRERDTTRFQLGVHLHDTVIQQMSAALIMSDMVAAADERGAGYVRQIRDYLTAAIDAARDTVGSLRPNELENGLSASLDVTVNMLRDNGVDVTVRDHSGGRFAKESELIAWRTINECATNIIKHAHATTASIDLDVRRANDGSWPELHASITDNGIGASAQAIRSRQLLGHTGVFSMQQAIAAFGGSFSITTLEGGGTVVTFTLPMPPRD